MASTRHKAPRVGIIGGGYTGAAVAIHLSRAAPFPLDISVVEPAAELGRGVAYGTTDPDHRTNGPTTTHSLYPNDAGHFDRLFRASQAFADDPECLDPAGLAFPHRSEMGRYVGQEVAIHQKSNPSGSTIRHIQDRAVNVTRDDNCFIVKLSATDDLGVDFLVVTTSNAPPAILPPFRGTITDHKAFFPDPWDLESLSHIAPNAQILIVGTGLTMADVTVAVLRDRPTASITAISRRGLLPKSQRNVLATETFLDIMSRDEPAFIARHGHLNSVRSILRALRDDARTDLAAGGEWQKAFDDVRDAAHFLWPSLSEQEQGRFLRHLSPWYETHRFRYPPQMDAKVQALIGSGRLDIRAAALINAARQQDRIEITTRLRGKKDFTTEEFDAVINCTGPDRKPSRSDDPFLQNLVSGGLLLNHSLGLGLVVDDLCRAQNSHGQNDQRIRIFGPLTRSRFGEANGVPHTTVNILRVMPDMLVQLGKIANAD